MNNIIYPVILCGGSGTRLWPLSRKVFPKQFNNLVGDQSLFQMTAERLNGDKFAEPLIITASDYRFITLEQLSSSKIAPSNILVEPSAKNTAAATCIAALELEALSPGSLMLLAPSDHFLPDVKSFEKVISTAMSVAEDDQIVTFGVFPDRAETGYGWLELSEGVSENDEDRSIKLKGFIEKPAKAIAEKLLKSNKYMWNSGIFLFKTSTIIKAFQEHAPEILAISKKVLEQSKQVSLFKHLNEEIWKDLPNISIDFAIMEKSSNLSVVPLNGAWSDLGDWKSVWQNNEPDSSGLVTRGPVTTLDCKNSLIYAAEEAQQIVGIGLENVIAVAMSDAVLVANKDKVQDVKAAVEVMKERGVSQAENLPRDNRPWGWYESLVVGSRFQVKRIVVKPGAALSLQSHNHRSEHWIVVEGTAKVIINEDEKLITENQSVYIPLGSKHRLENPGKVMLTLIEVQTGTYLGEDDIIRYEDQYARETIG